MCRQQLFGVLMLWSLSATAGTGHAKDLDLAYLIVLVIFALVIGIWNGIDFIGKNHEKLKERMTSFKEKLKSYFSRRFHKFYGPCGIH